MRAVLPGKPRATLQALSTAEWSRRRFVTYISGNAIVILDQPTHIFQTIYHDDVEAFDSVVFDELTGKIAACAATACYIYKPYGLDEGLLKWSLQCTINSLGDAELSKVVAWGSYEELLIGSSHLNIFRTEEECSLIWDREVSSPVTRAEFSSDAELLVTTAQYDRLVKVWRRLAFGSDVVQFDYGYLAHPTAVTGLQWRRTKGREHDSHHILYTTCADSKIRVWAASNPHSKQVMQLWREIDMQASVQPRDLQLSTTNATRFALFMASQDFQDGIANAMTSRNSSNVRPIMEHLSEIVANDPDVCLVLDDTGHMCAWALQNLGSRESSESDIINIAHVDEFKLDWSFNNGDALRISKLFGFLSTREDSLFSIIMHEHDGNITWLEGKIEDFLDPSPPGARLAKKASWTGHEAAIKKIVRTMGGRAIFSRTNDNDGYLWKQAEDSSGHTLVQRTLLKSQEHIHRTCVLAGGAYVANLHSESLSLWDTRGFEARCATSCGFQLQGKPLCLLQLPRPKMSSNDRYLATISSEMKGIVWKATLVPEEDATASERRVKLSEYSTFEIGSQDDLAYVLPIDPAGSKPMVSEFLDTFAKDVAMSYTTTGVLKTWTAKLNIEQASVDWLCTATVHTGVNEPSLASGSSIRKMALVNSTREVLTIWDTVGAQLEYEKHFDPGEMVQDLDWTSTPDDQSVLAVGFPHRVTILAQNRYDYLDKGPAWVPIRSISIRESTPHPIGDSVWLGNGNIVIGAGNQLFMFDKLISKQEDEMITELSVPVHSRTAPDLFDVVSALNGPLAIFHPQLLSQCILAGKLSLVSDVLVNLCKILNFWSDGDNLDSSLGMDTSSIFTEPQETLIARPRHQRKSSLINGFHEDEAQSVTEELALTLNDHLTKKSLPYLSSHEQMHLADLVECVATGEKHRRSMDENAMRYLLFFRQHMLRQSQSPARPPTLSWREFAWAFHSGSQDILVDLVSRHFSGKILWEHAKESGIFMWLTDTNTLRTQFETIARNEYNKTDDRDPTNCSLYYLALKKKNILVGLWRMAGWHREQKATQKLLVNNFEDPRWKTAALKNAYALLGKRRFEYAAAFFLLAGHLRDAVSICAKQLQDLQLAVAIARVYDGDDSEVLHDLLQDEVLPRAAAEGNRWMATWAFWLLGRRDAAVQALITSVDRLLDRPMTPTREGMSYLATDPALVVLYRQLRDKSLQTLKGATQITPRAEWEFVMQIARLYDRMGCDLLALDLVRNWEFLKQPSKVDSATNGVLDPRKLLRRRSSLVVDDFSGPKSPTFVRTPKATVFKQPPPQVFEEPEASSLLDSFGF